MGKGFIKLYRSIDDWEYRKDAKVFSVWMRLLTKTNYEDNEFSGMIIERGYCVISLGSLAEDCGFSVQNVRTALAKLEKSKCILSEGTNKFTIIKILNYEKYQNNENMEKEDELRKSFIFYRSYKEAIDELDENEKLEMYKSICEYGLDGTIPNYSGTKKALFNLIKPQIDANLRKYQKKISSKNNSESNLNLKISIVPQNE